MESNKLKYWKSDPDFENKKREFTKELAKYLDSQKKDMNDIVLKGSLKELTSIRRKSRQM